MIYIWLGGVSIFSELNKLNHSHSSTPLLLIALEASEVAVSVREYQSRGPGRALLCTELIARENAHTRMRARKQTTVKYLHIWFEFCKKSKVDFKYFIQKFKELLPIGLFSLYTPHSIRIAHFQKINTCLIHMVMFDKFFYFSIFSC